MVFNAFMYSINDNNTFGFAELGPVDVSQHLIITSTVQPSSPEPEILQTENGATFFVIVTTSIPTKEASSTMILL